jgi:hypothetical protein
MHVDQYLTHVRHAEENLSKGLKKITAQHVFETDVVEMCQRFSQWSEQHLSALQSFMSDTQGSDKTESPELFEALFGNVRVGPYSLLRDLHSLSLLIHDVQACWTVLKQGAMALRNTELENLCKEAVTHLEKESMWVSTRIKNAAAQILVVG